MTILSPDEHNAMMLYRVRRIAQPETDILRLALGEYIRQSWHVLEPNTRYMHGWHIDAICEHLTAVTHGQIRNLLINIPPRHMKSLSVSVFWPTWVWTFNPEKRWLFSSYAESLAIRDSLKCRRLIQSPWYQTRWSKLYQLTSDQNVKARFENDRTGYRLATSVGGSATGEGGDIIVCDDPHKTNEAESDTVRENVLIWWNETMSTRFNDPSTGAKVIVMQRIHENDLSGHVLEQGGYEHLCLPSEYEPRVIVTGIGWSDPRSREGELLWPERFGPAELEELKNQLGPYGTAGQLQQRPAPRGGGMFKREWFKFIDQTPADAARVRYWDKAGTEGAGAFSTGVLMARDGKGRFYIEDVTRGQWSIARRDEMMKMTAELDAETYGSVTAVHIWHEQEPGSGGKESAEATHRLLVGFVTHAEKVTGSKQDRAHPFASQCAAGNVYLVSADWNRGYLDRVCMFPAGRYKDDVDASSGAFNKLARATPVPREVLEEAAQSTPSRFMREATTRDKSRWRR